MADDYECWECCTSYDEDDVDEEVPECPDCGARLKLTAAARRRRKAEAHPICARCGKGRAEASEFTASGPRPLTTGRRVCLACATPIEREVYARSAP